MVQNNKRIVVDANLYDKVKPILDNQKVSVPGAIASFLQATIDTDGANLIKHDYHSQPSDQLNKILANVCQLRDEMIHWDITRKDTVDHFQQMYQEIGLNEITTFTLSPLVATDYGRYGIVKINRRYKIKFDYVQHAMNELCTYLDPQIFNYKYENKVVDQNEFMDAIKNLSAIIIDTFWILSMLQDQNPDAFCVSLDDNVVNMLYYDRFWEIRCSGPYSDLYMQDSAYCNELQTVTNYLRGWTDRDTKMNVTRITYQYMSNLMKDTTWMHSQVMYQDDLIQAALQLMTFDVNHCAVQEIRCGLIYDVVSVEDCLLHHDFKLMNMTNDERNMWLARQWKDQANDQMYNDLNLKLIQTGFSKTLGLELPFGGTSYEDRELLLIHSHLLDLYRASLVDNEHQTAMILRERWGSLNKNFDVVVPTYNQNESTLTNIKKINSCQKLIDWLNQDREQLTQRIDSKYIDQVIDEINDLSQIQAYHLRQCIVAMPIILKNFRLWN